MEFEWNLSVMYVGMEQTLEYLTFSVLIKSSDFTEMNETRSQLMELFDILITI
jgi:hypothetical protein